ncbi:MAG: hypothetical protein A3H93_10190 [Rhodocyclales bacterium RIFCSPLOWO2_02_FULL_63_24]|nr:MAG: hypothetical protein A2040_14320 [Rhodocyclales bacterium GWA2_65_19]OHC68413.1 MAG: hypothetical protein A3H93_10190 [Rhodocyclales bacterium RIFCSPLOWO2_02_FULL_63_24]
MRYPMPVLLLMCATAACHAQVDIPPAGAGCGEVVRVDTHERSTTRYALAHPRIAPAHQGVRMARRHQSRYHFGAECGDKT